MKLKISNAAKLFSLFSLCYFLGSCCDDDSKKVFCREGFEEVNGNCECPQGKFRAYGFCRELQGNEWYGITDGCPCMDTIFFKITDIQGSTAYVQLNDDFIIDPPNPGWSVKGGFEVKYIESPNGDSIAPSSLPYGQPCNADNFGAAEFYELFYGKFSPSGDTLNMKIVFRDFQFPGIIKDSCYVLFHK